VDVAARGDVAACVNKEERRVESVIWCGFCGMDNTFFYMGV